MRSVLSAPSARAQGPVQDRAKRWFDFAAALGAMVVLLPLLLVIAIAIKLDSAGPVLFGQERVGAHGTHFRIWKFRSMRADNDQTMHLEAAEAWFRGQPGEDGFKSTRDPRVTRVGRLLRQASLDELPQLINVLRGQMSLVGPRPMMPYDRPLYEPWYFEREVVRPGITGIWQVSGRSRVSAAEMMAMDVEYVRKRSFWFDLKLILRTLPALIHHRGV